jgi:PAS domain S-box-containing protein
MGKSEEQSNAEAMETAPEAANPQSRELRLRQEELQIRAEDIQRLQAELESARARYVDFYDLAPVGYCTINAHGLILDANLTTASMLGVVRNSLPGQCLSEFVVKEDQSLLNSVRNRIFETGESQRCDLRIVKADNSPFYANLVAAVARDVDGAPACRIMMSDISERRRAEEALQENEALFRRLFVESPVGAVMVGQDFRFRRCNQAFCAFLGYQEGELIGQAFLDVTFPEDRMIGATEIQDILRGSLDVVQFQKRYVRKDGAVVWGEINIRMMRDKDKAHLHFLSIVQDITERKRVEEERGKLQAQLQQAQKMESVGRLAGGVAHDFNNKLGVIMGHVEMALEQVDATFPIREDLEEIRRAAQRSADLTRQLLAFARKQTIAPKVLNLNETVTGMLKMLKRLLGEEIDLRWNPTASLWSVKVDPSQIDQILVNLCVNARDAIAGIGRLTIDTENRRLDKAYCAAHVGAVPGEFVGLSVTDTGCGMDKETLAHIFEPFFTTKGVGKGTGLGLATVYGAVKQNAGFIQADSEPGMGTTITIYLPRNIGQPELVRTEVAEKPVLSGHETILLVEDESAILEMTATVLRRKGYTVLMANAPGEAMRLANQHKGVIHLVVTDVVMPEMNGRDLAQRLLSMRPGMRCLFMSGHTAEVIADHGVLDEGVDFVQKPFLTEVLASKIRQMLDGGSQGT